MVSFLDALGFVIELIALLSFFVVVYYVYEIRLLTKGFQKIWSFIALAFLLIIFMRGLGFISPYIESGNVRVVIDKLVIPILLLTTSGLYIYGFYKLKKLFKNIVDDKINHDHKLKRK